MSGDVELVGWGKNSCHNTSVAPCVAEGPCFNGKTLLVERRSLHSSLRSSVETTGSYFGTEIVTSLEVMNSSSAGTPFLVCSMPRLMAGMMSSGLVTRSP